MKLIKAKDLTNEQYHGEKDHYSSSQLKLALQDIELFHKQYVLGEVVREEIPAFAVGTFFHTAILEPEKLEEECAVFTGKMRRGKAWEDFKEANAGKAIITSSDYDKAMTLIECTKKNSIVSELMNGGEAELSCMAELEGVKIKVRADFIDIERGFIMDLKSTTGNCKDQHKTIGKISNYQYDLSAALYMDAFNAALGSKRITSFYWPFASKDMGNCQVYRATNDMIEVGRAKYKKAISLIKKYTETDWVFIDEVVAAFVPQWEKDMWIKKQTDNGSNLI